MADDKGKKAEDQEQEGGKKGLPPIVLVAVGAALGGAGVVFLSPAPPAVDPNAVHVHEPKYVLREHPDILKFHFNPRQERGSMMAKIEFRFVYKLDEAHEDEVVELITKHWNLMSSEILTRLRRETPQSLRDTDANDILANDLIQQMSLTLFPEGEAVVTKIIWKSFYLQ